MNLTNERNCKRRRIYHEKWTGSISKRITYLTDKSSYKYLSEVAGNGKYIQVAWQKKNAEYLALYGTQSIKLPQIDNSVEFVDAEEG